MPAVAGSIQEVSIDGRPFAVAADAESQRKLGGWENEVMANGNGTARIIKTRVPMKIDGLTLETDDDRGDQEFLQAIADSPDFKQLSITYASGVVYQGTGTITGEMQTSSQSAATAVTLEGPGNLTKQ